MYTTFFYGFSGMHNSFLMLKFPFQFKVMSKSRWPSNAILEIDLSNYLRRFDIFGFMYFQTMTVNLTYFYLTPLAHTLDSVTFKSCLPLVFEVWFNKGCEDID